MSYAENYIKSVEGGYRNAEFHISQNRCDITDFFENIIQKTEYTKSNNGKIFFVGNGASAALCNHMALDWSKNGKILANSLSDSALLTALTNDYSFQDAFVEFLKMNSCGANDIVVTVSSSGNSPNVVNVLKYCNENDITSIGFSGLKSDNQTVQLAKYSLHVSVKTYGMAECIHQVFLHLWLDKYMEIYEWSRDDFQNMNVDGFKL